MNAAVNPGPAKGFQGKVIKGVLAIAMIAVLAAALRYFDLQPAVRGAIAWISGLGPLGVVIFIGLYILGSVVSFPASILTLGAGVVFGLLKGAIAVSIGSTLGAACAFLIARHLARDWVAARIAGNEKFKAIDDAVGREGWKIVLLTRLSPLFPFVMLNYLFGLTKVSFKHYLLASWVGMIPATVMYVYVGSLAGDLARLGTDAHRRSTLEWILYCVGLLAAIAVTIFVTRLARKSLATWISP